MQLCTLIVLTRSFWLLNEYTFKKPVIYFILKTKCTLILFTRQKPSGYRPGTTKNLELSDPDLSYKNFHFPQNLSSLAVHLPLHTDLILMSTNTTSSTAITSPPLRVHRIFLQTEQVKWFSTNSTI